MGTLVTDGPAPGTPGVGPLPPLPPDPTPDDEGEPPPSEGIAGVDGAEVTGGTFVVGTGGVVGGGVWEQAMEPTGTTGGVTF